MEEVERRRKHDQQSLFMRVKVAIPISKPLRRGGFLASSDEEKVWTTFKYERLPMFCHHCGLLGHDTRHCVKYFALTTNGKETSLQYGKWLKVSGAWRWSSSVKNSQRNTMVEDGCMKTNVQGEAAVDSFNLANPSEQEGNGKGNTSKSRDIQEVGFNGAEIVVNVEIDMDWLASGCKGNRSLEYRLKTNMTKENLMLHAEKNVLNMGSDSSEHVEDKVSVGPNESKIKPTWTRLAHMIEGYKNSTLVEPNMILGKQGV